MRHLNRHLQFFRLLFAISMVVVLIAGCSSGDKGEGVAEKKILSVDKKFTDKLTSDPDFQDWKEIDKRYKKLKDNKKSYLDFYKFLQEKNIKWKVDKIDIYRKREKDFEEWTRYKIDTKWEWLKNYNDDLIRNFKWKIFKTILYKNALPIPNGKEFGIEVGGYLEYRGYESGSKTVKITGEVTYSLNDYVYIYSGFSEEEKKSRKKRNLHTGNEVWITTDQEVEHPDDFQGLEKGSWYDNSRVLHVSYSFSADPPIDYFKLQFDQKVPEKEIDEIFLKANQKTLKWLAQEPVSRFPMFDTPIYRALGEEAEAEVKLKLQNIADASKEELIELSDSEYDESNEMFFRTFNTTFEVGECEISVMYIFDKVLILISNKEYREIGKVLEQLVEEY
ncbi:MAG: hypothetical protein ABIH35_00830 [Patescibacteria group bacterium]